MARFLARLFYLLREFFIKCCWPFFHEWCWPNYRVFAQLTGAERSHWESYGLRGLVSRQRNPLVLIPEGAILLQWGCKGNVKLITLGSVSVNVHVHLNRHYLWILNSICTEQVLTWPTANQSRKWWQLTNFHAWNGKPQVRLLNSHSFDIRGWDRLWVPSICDLPVEKGNRLKTKTRSNAFENRLNAIPPFH